MRKILPFPLRRVAQDGVLVAAVGTHGVSPSNVGTHKSGTFADGAARVYDAALHMGMGHDVATLQD